MSSKRSLMLFFDPKCIHKLTKLSLLFCWVKIFSKTSTGSKTYRNMLCHNAVEVYKTASHILRVQAMRLASSNVTKGELVT